MTWIVICAVLIFGVIAYRRHMRAPSASGRRKTYAWAWAFWGAIAGSFFGIAGFGTAVSGAGLGAVVGYLAATALIRVDPPDSGNNAAPPKRAVVEPGTFAITQDRTLREAIGIETLGGVFTPILEQGSQIPCSVSQAFSTAEDGQAQITIRLFRGNSDLVRSAHHLGAFQIGGIPPLPRGEPKVLVEFRVDMSGIHISVSDNHEMPSVSIAWVAA